MFGYRSIVASLLAGLLVAAPCFGGQNQRTAKARNPFRTAAAPTPVQASPAPTPADGEPIAPLEFDATGWDEPMAGGDPAGAGGGCCEPVCGAPVCGCATCRPCDEPMFWAEADYLLWWTKGMRVPALVTTSPNDTSSDVAGMLDRSSTSILFGDSVMNDGVRSGGRFELGAWLNRSHCNALQVEYMFLEDEQQSFHGSQDNYTILARPFADVVSGLDDAYLIDYPNLVEGSLDVSVETRFDSLAFMYRATTIRSPYGSFGVFGGYRFAQLNDDITITSSTLGLSGAAAGTSYELYDAFDTRNTFNGGEIAVDFQEQLGDCWWGQMGAKVALGATRSRTNIGGQTTQIDSTSTTVYDGGLLTQGTNLGSHGTTNVSSILEFDVSIRRKLSPCTALVFGYDCVFWTKVLRAGDQIDLGVNPSQIQGGTLVGDARPAFPNAASTYWAQGLRFGFEAQF